MRPYRDPAHVEADVQERSLGAERSVHAPPPLLHALVGPVLIAALI